MLGAVGMVEMITMTGQLAVPAVMRLAVVHQLNVPTAVVVAGHRKREEGEEQFEKGVQELEDSELVTVLVAVEEEAGPGSFADAGCMHLLQMHVDEPLLRLLANQVQFLLPLQT